MKAKFMMTAAALALVAGGANAQVVTELTDLAEQYGGVFVNVSTNLEAIDGSINITGDGTGGGSLTGAFNFDEGVTLTDIDITGQASDGLIGGGSVEVFGDGGGVEVCDAEGDGAQCDVAGSFSDFANASGNFDAVVNSTTVAFGNLATLAAGAVNETTTDLTEQAGEIVASSGSFTSDTGSDASFEALSGAGTIVLSGATNIAGINGSVNVGIGGGNMAGGDISTTAAGAISTADITATFFGEAEGGPLIP